MQTGEVGAFQMTQGFLFAAAVLMETAIAMVLLSRFLAYRANRWANVAVGVLHTLAVLASLFAAGAPKPFYVLFATVEVACTVYIVWYAWRWRPAPGAPSGA